MLQFSRFYYGCQFLITTERGKMRKEASPFGSILANFLRLPVSYYHRESKNEKRGLSHWLQFIRFYSGCQFLITTERAKRRKGDSSIWSNLADFTIAYYRHSKICYTGANGRAPFSQFSSLCGNKKLAGIVKSAKLEPMGEAPFLIFALSVVIRNWQA